MMDAPVHAIDDETYAIAQFAHGRLQPLRQRPHPRLPFPGKPITLKRLEPADAERSVEISADLAGESCRVRYFYSAILCNVRTLSRATAASSCRQSHLELAAGCLISA
jgi:hypothetical protein